MESTLLKELSTAVSGDSGMGKIEKSIKKVSRYPIYRSKMGQQRTKRRAMKKLDNWPSDFLMKSLTKHKRYKKNSRRINEKHISYVYAHSTKTPLEV